MKPNSQYGLNTRVDKQRNTETRNTEKWYLTTQPGRYTRPIIYKNGNTCPRFSQNLALIKGGYSAIRSTYWLENFVNCIEIWILQSNLKEMASSSQVRLSWSDSSSRTSSSESWKEHQRFTIDR